MDFQTARRILGLDSHVSIAELRQVYRDLVNVWHPDRFAHNPRLRRKAENRLKEINEAYRCLRGATGETAEPPPGPEPDPPGEGAAGGRETAKSGRFKKDERKRKSVWTRPRRRRWWSAGMGIVALPVLAFFLWGPESEPPPPVIAEPEPPPPYDAVSEPPRTPSEWPEWLVRLQRRMEWWDRHGNGSSPSGMDTNEAEEVRRESPGTSADALADVETNDDWPGLIPPDMNLPPIRDMPRFPDEVTSSRRVPEPRPQRRASLPPPESEPTPARRLSPELVRLRSRLANQVRARADRYRDRGDGTVLDTRTGRVWTLSNSYLETGRLLSFDEAGRYVRSLRTGGRRDWRLPRSDELAEIYLNGLRYPAGGASVLWSSEVYVKGWHNVVRVVRPDSERVALANQSERGVVHAVRP
ncbi:MAG: DUF1566 domain-containing protein [Desulfococcaceae bacterium]